jgi:hypothetical protein
MRRADDNGARDPAAQAPHAGEGLCRHRPRVGVARVRSNDAAAVGALLNLSGREEIGDGSA